MSRKLIFTLIIFLAAVSSFVFVKFSLPNNPTQTSSSKSKPAALPLPTGTSLAILPSPLAMTSGESASADVVINSAVKPTLVQLEIGYDPTVLFSVNVLPGNYFINPTVILEKIDAKNGRISYALRCGVENESESLSQCLNPNENTLATIYFSSLHFGFQKITKLSFLPKTSLKKNNEDVLLTGTKEADIILKPSFFAPVATPSASILTQ